MWLNRKFPTGMNKVYCYYYLSVCVCVRACHCASYLVSVFAGVHLSVFASVHLLVFVSLSMSVLVSVFVSVHLLMFVSLCVSEHVIVGVSVCFCAFVSVCVIVGVSVCWCAFVSICVIVCQWACHCCVSVCHTVMFAISFRSVCLGGVHVGVHIIVSIGMHASFASACLPQIFCEWYKVRVYTYAITVKESSDLDHNIISPVKTAVRKCMCDLIYIDAYQLTHFFTFYFLLQFL